MKTRILAAAVGLAVLLPALIFGGPAAVWIIVGIALLICLDEYSKMAFPDDVSFALSWLVGVGGCFALAVAGGSSRVLIIVALVGLLATLVQVMLRPGPELSVGAERAGRYLIGIVWIAGLLPILVRLRGLPKGEAVVLLVLVISWFGDTGAYFAGRSFGKTPLYSRVSPKKTREGAIGGMVMAILGVLLIKGSFLHSLTLLDCMLLGGLGSAMSIAGDLFESLLKRAHGVKDSGWIMPGHGGLLDRIDSVLFVAPTVYVYLLLRGGG